MAKNHSFLGLLCIAFICIHFYPSCYSVRPGSYAEPGSEVVNLSNSKITAAKPMPTKEEVSAKPIHAKNETTANHSVAKKATEAKPIIVSKATAAKIKKVKQIYDSQVGVREQGHNAGKKVEAYLAYTGLGKGHAWCASFICWVYGQAQISNPKTAWSPGLFPSSKIIWRKTAGPNLVSSQAKAQVYSQKTPRTGDIFGIYFSSKKRIAHAGFVDNWQGNWVITVEGNTNPEGHREGDGVYRKRRLTKSIYTVARYIN